MEAERTLPLLQLSNGQVRLEATGASDIGLRRTNNEDTLGLLPDAYQELGATLGFLFAVADGMGGARKGEVASRIAVEAVFTTYYDTSLDAVPDLPGAAALLTSFNAANDAVYQETLALDTGTMGTTLVASVVVGDRAIVGNVGDSRAYLIRGGRLVQITEDHSIVAEQVRAGIMTPEEARVSPYRNIITRAVGHQAQVETDHFEIAPLQPGDVLLLCSDGLFGMIDDDELLAIGQQPDLRQAAQEYITIANAHGGADNVTCLLVRVLPVDRDAVPASP